MLSLSSSRSKERECERASAELERATLASSPLSLSLSVELLALASRTMLARRVSRRFGCAQGALSSQRTRKSTSRRAEEEGGTGCIALEGQGEGNASAKDCHQLWTLKRAPPMQDQRAPRRRVPLERGMVRRCRRALAALRPERTLAPHIGLIKSCSFIGRVGWRGGGRGEVRARAEKEGARRSSCSTRRCRRRWKRSRVGAAWN